MPFSAEAVVQARASEGARGLGLLSRQDLAAAPPVSAVLEAPALFALMQGLLQVFAHNFESYLFFVLAIFVWACM